MAQSRALTFMEFLIPDGTMQIKISKMDIVILKISKDYCEYLIDYFSTSTCSSTLNTRTCPFLSSVICTLIKPWQYFQEGKSLIYSFNRTVLQALKICFPYPFLSLQRTSCLLLNRVQYSIC